MGDVGRERRGRAEGLELEVVLGGDERHVDAVAGQVTEREEGFHGRGPPTGDDDVEGVR